MTQIEQQIFEKMKAKDFGESMCNETKLNVLKWTMQQLRKHDVSGHWADSSSLFPYYFLTISLPFSSLFSIRGILLNTQSTTTYQLAFVAAFHFFFVFSFSWKSFSFKSFFGHVIRVAVAAM